MTIPLDAFLQRKLALPFGFSIASGSINGLYLQQQQKMTFSSQILGFVDSRKKRFSNDPKFLTKKSVYSVPKSFGDLKFSKRIPKGDHFLLKKVTKRRPIFKKKVTFMDIKK